VTWRWVAGVLVVQPQSIRGSTHIVFWTRRPSSFIRVVFLLRLKALFKFNAKKGNAWWIEIKLLMHGTSFAQI